MSSACGCWVPRCGASRAGSATLKDAINEAMRDWVTNVRTTYYILGSALGAHPYPTMVRDFHRVSATKQGADAGAGGQAADCDGRLRGRRIERDWGILRVSADAECAARWRGGGRTRDGAR